MADVRIKDLSSTATSAANDDYLALDGSTNGTRKILASNIGGGGGSVSPYTSNPAALGTASPGSSDNYARGDHVHPKPSAADLGITVPQAATANPSNLGTATVGSSSKYAKEDHVHNLPSNATTLADGLMSATDKSHLDTVYADYSSALTALGVS